MKTTIERKAELKTVTVTSIDVMASVFISTHDKVQPVGIVFALRKLRCIYLLFLGLSTAGRDASLLASEMPKITELPYGDCGEQ